MQVRVLYFGVLKDLLHRSGDEVQLPPSASVGTLLDVIRGREAAMERIWDTLAIAVNREYAQAELALCDGDEVALMPPVSGGSGRESGLLA